MADVRIRGPRQTLIDKALDILPQGLYKIVDGFPCASQNVAYHWNKTSTALIPDQHHDRPTPLPTNISQI